MRNLPVMLLALVLCGCSLYSKDISKNIGTRSDYVIGQVYQTTGDLLLMRSQEDDPKQKNLAKMTLYVVPTDYLGAQTACFDSEGMPVSVAQVFVRELPAGTRFKVTKITEDWGGDVGKFVSVYAVIMTGKCAGTVCDLSYISVKESYKLGTFINPDLLLREGQ